MRELKLVKALLPEFNREKPLEVRGVRLEAKNKNVGGERLEVGGNW